MKLRRLMSEAGGERWLIKFEVGDDVATDADVDSIAGRDQLWLVFLVERGN